MLPAAAHECAAWVRSGKVSALELAEATLACIAMHDGKLNSYTAITAERVRRAAAEGGGRAFVPSLDDLGSARAQRAGSGTDIRRAAGCRSRRPGVRRPRR
jgi:hypothetical protein